MPTSIIHFFYFADFCLAFEGNVTLIAYLFKSDPCLAHLITSTTRLIYRTKRGWMPPSEFICVLLNKPYTSIQMKNFVRLQTGIDVQPLLHQIAEYPNLWNASDQWSAGNVKPAIEAVDNIVLRYNRSPDWNKPAFWLLSAAQKIIFDLMRVIPGEHLGKVLITRLRPGQTIPDHIDIMPPGIPLYYHRFQIPLNVKPGVVFRCGEEQLEMRPGEAWWFNNQLLHSVHNNSDHDRISMLCDIRPFMLDNLSYRPNLHF